jgi:hypothetical protein
MLIFNFKKIHIYGYYTLFHPVFLSFLSLKKVKIGPLPMGKRPVFYLIYNV